MKKFISIIVIVFLSIHLFSVPAYADNEILVLLDGKTLHFDVNPQIINNRTMVPMRKIFETLGATVEWENSTQKIVAHKQGTSVVMQINSNILLVNDKVITLDVAPQIVNSRTLVPVRAVAESFNIDVAWDAASSAVILSSVLQFETPIATYDYLKNWLIQNGVAFGDYIYIRQNVEDDISIDICYYPQDPECITLRLASYKIDTGLTSLNLWPEYNNASCRASYISTTDSSRIRGQIDISNFTENYPLFFDNNDFELGEFSITYDLVEYTRAKINYLIKESDIILQNYANISINSLGFKNY